MPARKGRPFLSFAAARRKVKALGISSHTAYKAFDKARLAREGLPTNPHIAYASHWLGWPYFLGTGPKKSRPKAGGRFLSYDEARRRVIEAGIRTSDEYAARRAWRIKNNLPSTPYVTYGSQWKGWKQFLGTRKKSPEEIADICKKANVTSFLEYRARRAWRQKNCLPTTPPRGLFSQNVVHEPVSYEQARKVVRELKVRTTTEYGALTLETRLRHNLPKDPAARYAGQYRADHFYALARKATRWRGARTGGARLKPVSLEQARRLVRDLGVRTLVEYVALPFETRRAHGLPSSLHKAYGDSWPGADYFFALARRASDWQKNPSGPPPRAKKVSRKRGGDKRAV